jgi:hypothetical protein
MFLPVVFDAFLFVGFFAISPFQFVALRFSVSPFR